MISLRDRFGFMTPRRCRLFAAIALTVFFVLLRALYLRADPPLTYPTGEYCADLFVEPPAKAHEARNHALFGVWKTSPVDNYQFWRVQSPVWVYPLAGFFHGFGVSYASLRAYAVLFSTVGFVALLAVAARQLRGAGFFTAGVMVACNAMAIFYDRSGMIEPAVNAFLTLSMLGSLLARRNLMWLILAQWALCLAFLTKQTGLYLAPVVVCVQAWTLWKSSSRQPWREPSQVAVVVHGLVLGLGLVFYVSRPEYVRSLVWNFGHVVHGVDGTTSLSTEDAAPKNLLATIANPAKLKIYWMLFSVAGILAPLEMIRLAVHAATRRRISQWHALVALWWASAMGVLLLSKANEVRYYLILFPPAALLSGSLIQDVWAKVRFWRWAQPMVALLVAVPFFAISGDTYTRWLKRLSYSIHETNQRVEQHIGDRSAVVIGLWSAPLVLETPYHHYYVKNDFNASRKALVELAPTHLLLLDSYDFTRAILDRNFPKLLGSIEPQVSFEMRRKKVRLFELNKPLR